MCPYANVGARRIIVLKVGTEMCQCGACGLYFFSDDSFQRHRTGPINARTCLSVAELRDKGMSPDDRGVWGRRSAPPTRLDRLKAT